MRKSRLCTLEGGEKVKFDAIAELWQPLLARGRCVIASARCGVSMLGRSIEPEHMERVIVSNKQPITLDNDASTFLELY
ncbi:hypothetical protein NDU88_000919 [Pleurodeles waltl]|uniref:Uncharacterized protein n=1 Tax=Pleurodeles waltl TaxID=8319 RepID=A0AAV7MJF8_PLEWA|nr:hypothetical protein NDU88_000919 [Pleurodeles waltl]